MARPFKPIDWNTVETMIEAGCTASEISACFRIDPTNFYDRFNDKYGTNFTTYASHVRCAGLGNVRRAQYEKAMEGNVQMLTILGREWLGQEKEQKQRSQADEARLDALINQLEALRSSSNIATSNNKTEDKS